MISTGSMKIFSAIAPCPFCGSSDCMIRACGNHKIAVTCPVCGVRGPISLKSDNALAAWCAMPRACDTLNQKSRMDEPTIESEKGAA